MCLDKTVGSGWACDESGAPRTLQSIGISESMISDILGDDYDSPEDLVDEKIKFAQQEIYDTASQHFSESTARAGLIEDRTIGEKQSGMKSAHSGFGGVILRVDNELDLSVNINRVAFQLNFTGTIQLNIYRMTDGVVVHQEDVDITAGVIKIVDLDVEVYTHRRDLKVAIGYNKTGIQSYHYAMPSDCPACPYTKCGLYVDGYGADFTEDFSTVTRTGHTSGMSIDYSISCKYERLVCANIHQLRSTMLWLVAKELMIYGINSRRWNESDVERHKESLRYYSDNYDRSINVAFQNIRMPSNECFGCGRQLGTKTITP